MPLLGGVAPETPHFELFMDEHNQKISKTKGNGLTMEAWLRYGGPDSLAYYMFTSPKTAKRLYFDVIPKATDEYLQHLESYNRARAEGSNAANPLDNPVWSVTAGDPPARGSPISFSLLLNLVTVVGSGDPAVIWGFLARYLPGASPESEPMLARLVDYAIHYYEDFVLPAKTYRSATEAERAAFADLVRAPEGAARRLPGRRGDPERGLRGRQGGRLRAAARLVPGALRSAARPEPSPALRLVRRDLRAGKHHHADRKGAGVASLLQNHTSRTQRPSRGRSSKVSSPSKWSSTIAATASGSARRRLTAMRMRPSSFGARPRQ